MKRSQVFKNKHKNVSYVSILFLKPTFLCFSNPCCSVFDSFQCFIIQCKNVFTLLLLLLLLMKNILYHIK